MSPEHPNVVGMLVAHAWPITKAGGQHVGMSTGVLVCHIDSGLAVVANNSRSRYANMQEALATMAAWLGQVAPQYIKEGV